MKSLKTTANWLFNDIWHYLGIGCFEWNIGIFQQTVVRVYYILKVTQKWSQTYKDGARIQKKKKKKEDYSE